MSTDELTNAEQAVLAAVWRRGDATIPMITSDLPFTQPTVGSAIARLEALGLVAVEGRTKGKLGRAAAVYAVAPGAGWVLGADVGTTQLTIRASRISGQTLDTHSVALRGSPDEQRDQLLAELNRYSRVVTPLLSQEHGRLLAIGVAVPRYVPDYLTSHVDARDPSRHTFAQIFEAISPPTETPIVVENNVKCAALAELVYGAAYGATDYVYLQVGVGIGSGVVVNGRLLRGARGAAGEIAALRLAWPASPGGPEFELEEYLRSDALVRRCAATWPASEGTAPSTIIEILELGEAGVAPARAALQQYARDVAQLAHTLITVIDPSVLLIGGRVGQNPALFDLIAQETHVLHPELSIRPGLLGDDATVRGAIGLSLDHVLGRLLGPHYDRRIDESARVVVAPPVTTSS